MQERLVVVNYSVSPVESREDCVDEFMFSLCTELSRIKC